MAVYYWVKLVFCEEPPVPDSGLPQEKGVRIDVHRDAESGELYGFVIDTRSTHP